MILMIGVNHRTARLELRERLALEGDRLDAAYERLGQMFADTERVIVHTCNRTELYIARPAYTPPTAEQVIEFLSGFCGVDRAALQAASIHHENEQAVGHLFRVAAGLDSMVLGERQVLGQIKRAYEDAHGRGVVGAVLHKIFQTAISTARRVRHETGIDSGRVSVGSVAVDFARQIFDRFDDKTVVGIGAGEMAKLTLRHLEGLSPEKLWLVNRTPQRAAAMARSIGLDASRGGPRAFDDLGQLLIEADIVLTSTSATSPIITAQRCHLLMRSRRNRPLFIIDLALPRDVEPSVGSMRNVYLFNLDDLQRVVSGTYAQQADEVEHCQSLLNEAVGVCLHEVRHRDAGQLIKQLRERLHEMGAIEQQRTLRKLEVAEPRDAAKIVEEHSRRLINKILHLPLSAMDPRDRGAPLSFYAAALRKLFYLDEQPPQQGQADKPPPESCGDPNVAAPKRTDDLKMTTGRD